MTVRLIVPLILESQLGPQVCDPGSSLSVWEQSQYGVNTSAFPTPSSAQQDGFGSLQVWLWVTFSCLDSCVVTEA